MTVQSRAREDAAEAVLKAVQRAYSQGSNTTLSGNISHRIGKSGDHILITPSGLDKVSITPNQLSTLSVNTGEHLIGPKPSSEYRVHTAIYQVSEANAIVHTHGAELRTAIAVLGTRRFTETLEKVSVAEERDYYVGKFVSIPWIPAGTPEIAKAVSEVVKYGATVVLMEKHGPVGIGETMEKALDRVEYMNLLARMVLVAKSISK